MRKRIAAAVLVAGFAGGALWVTFGGATASVPLGNFMEVGCDPVNDVLVYATTDRDGTPTGNVAAVRDNCGDGPVGSLMNYVRVREDPYGNIVVRLYGQRRAGGTPLDIAVVDGHSHDDRHG